MKSLIPFLAILIACISSACEGLVSKNSFLVMVGDSITANNATGTLGCYPTTVSALLSTQYDYAPTTINSGYSGNSSKDILDRWQTAVLNWNPGAVVILCGTNDLYHHVNNSADPSKNISPVQYKANLREMISRTRAALPSAKILILSPFIISKNAAEIIHPSIGISHWNKLPEYIAAAESVASEETVNFINLHQRFQDAMQHIPAYYWCQHPHYQDSIHPGEKGNLFIARRVLDVIKFSK